jgi:hypothetical protein
MSKHPQFYRLIGQKPVPFTHRVKGTGITTKRISGRIATYFINFPIPNKPICRVCLPRSLDVGNSQLVNPRRDPCVSAKL